MVENVLKQHLERKEWVSNRQITLLSLLSQNNIQN